MPAPATPRNDLVEIFLTGITTKAGGPIKADLNSQLNNADVNAEQVPAVGDAAAEPARAGRPRQPNRLGVLAGDLQGFPNGRRLTDDVVDIELQALEGAAQTGKLVDALAAGDKVNANDNAFGDVVPVRRAAQRGRGEQGRRHRHRRPASAGRRRRRRGRPLRPSTSVGAAPAAYSAQRRHRQHGRHRHLGRPVAVALGGAADRRLADAPAPAVAAVTAAEPAATFARQRPRRAAGLARSETRAGTPPRRPCPPAGRQGRSSTMRHRILIVGLAPSCSPAWAQSFGLRHGASPAPARPGAGSRRGRAGPRRPARRRHRPRAAAAAARCPATTPPGPRSAPPTSSGPGSPPIPPTTRRPRARCDARSQLRADGQRRPRWSGSARSPTPATTSPPPGTCAQRALARQPVLGRRVRRARRRAHPARRPRRRHRRRAAHARPAARPRRLRPRLVRPRTARPARRRGGPHAPGARRRGRPGRHRVLPLPARRARLAAPATRRRPTTEYAAGLAADPATCRCSRGRAKVAAARGRDRRGAGRLRRTHRALPVARTTSSSTPSCSAPPASRRAPTSSSRWPRRRNGCSPRTAAPTTWAPRSSRSPRATPADAVARGRARVVAPALRRRRRHARLGAAPDRRQTPRRSAYARNGRRAGRAQRRVPVPPRHDRALARPTRATRAAT